MASQRRQQVGLIAVIMMAFHEYHFRVVVTILAQVMSVVVSGFLCEGFHGGVLTHLSLLLRTVELVVLTVPAMGG